MILLKMTFEWFEGHNSIDSFTKVIRFTFIAKIQSSEKLIASSSMLVLR